MFCFECGFKIVEGSKFCSSCGTPQITKSQTFQVTLTLFSESWTEEIEGSEDDEDSAAEDIQRGDDGWGSYLTFAEGSEQNLEASPFFSTKVNYEKVAEPEIGFGDHRIDFISSNFQETMWEFVVRYEVEVQLQVTSSSELSVREICQQQVKEVFALYASAFGEIVPIEELRIDDILDEAAIAKRRQPLIK